MENSALRPEVAVRRLCESLPAGEGEPPVFLIDRNLIPADPRRFEGIVMPDGGKDRIRAILNAGAPRVFIGEDALLDGALVEKLAAEFGSGRIGLYVPVRRMQVSWSMDIDSNADFRVMTPSVCEPCWEILRADGSGSGTHAAWWIGEMFGLGASDALIRVDIGDDADLNILAGLTERWGSRLWLAPLDEANPDLEAWVRLGGAARLAVPDAIYQNSPYLTALRSAPQTGQSNEGNG
jgi:hypothetical protein